MRQIIGLDAIDSGPACQRKRVVIELCFARYDRLGIYFIYLSFLYQTSDIPRLRWW